MANTLSVTIYNSNFQQLGVWIDWNDDGDFDDDMEQQHLSQDIASSSTVSVALTYPSTKPYGDYVRLRLITDTDDRYGTAIISGACHNSLSHGQSEDYAIYVKPQLSVSEYGLEQLNVSAINKSIIIEGNVNNNTKLVVYDIQGKQILTKSLDASLNANYINVSALSSGIYITKLIDEASVLTKKLIIK